VNDDHLFAVKEEEKEHLCSWRGGPSATDSRRTESQALSHRYGKARAWHCSGACGCRPSRCRAPSRRGFQEPLTVQ
jgi:hypothetical protein